MVIRKIVRIDEEKCNGCGVCVPSCAEGAIRVIDGKAKLVSEVYCDGLGACLGECPLDAISIEEREAPDFDEIEAMKYAARIESQRETVHACPSSRVLMFGGPKDQKNNQTQKNHTPSTLGNWPVQLGLVPPHAPFLKGSEILLAADCVPFAYPDFHSEFLEGKSLLIACPKLDDYDSHLNKLVQILQQAKPVGISVLRMEVPCCGGLTHLVYEASRMAGVTVPIDEITIGIRGEVLTRV